MIFPEIKCSLSRLPPELVVTVASFLDLPSYLALASSSNALANLLLSKAEWTTLLGRTKMNGSGLENVHSLKRLRVLKGEMSAELKQLVDILRFVKEDPDSSFLLSLLDFICERFPIIKKDESDDFSAGPTS